jgi:hypothetical protein
MYYSMQIYETVCEPMVLLQLVNKFLEPLSILIEYKTSETPKIDNIFIYLRFNYISVIIRIN